MNVTESPFMANERLAREYDSVSADLYNPLFKNQLDPAAQARAMQHVQAIADDPVMIDAQTRAQRIFDRDRRNGLVTGGLMDNYARALHYMKMGIDGASKFATHPLQGLDATEVRGIREMRRQFVNMIDETIPNYREARQRWAGISSAEDALEEGGRWLSMRGEEVAARRQEMTPFELQHARIGLVDSIRGATRGAVNRNKNVAIALDDPDIQEAIAAAFDTPEQAAQFLSSVNTQYELMRNASTWGGGSSTYANAAHGDSQIAATMIDAGLSGARGDVGGFLNRQGGKIGNFITAGMQERADDVVGAAMARPVTGTPDAPDFARQVIELLQQQEQRAATNTRASTAAGAAAGGAYGRRKDRR